MSFCSWPTAVGRGSLDRWQRSRKPNFVWAFWHSCPAVSILSVGGRNMLMVVVLTCSIHMTVYYYVDNANNLPTPSESYFA
jgi:hypothetical protein